MSSTPTDFQQRRKKYSVMTHLLLLDQMRQLGRVSSKRGHDLKLSEADARWRHHDYRHRRRFPGFEKKIPLQKQIPEFRELISDAVTERLLPEP